MENNFTSTASETITKIIETISDPSFQDPYKKSKNVYGDRFSLIIYICEISGEKDLAEEIKKYEFPMYNENYNIIKSRELIEKINTDIHTIIDNKFNKIGNSDKKDVIKYCLDCLANYHQIVTPIHTNLTAQKNELSNIIKEYEQKLDKEFFSSFKKIKHKNSYVSDKITEIGDFINKESFLKKAHKEFLFSLCKNPFLLLVPIAEVLKEEEAGKKIVSTINETLKILKINTNYNKEIKPELLDRNNLIKISAVLADSIEIDNVEYNNKDNANIFKTFLDGIEFQYAHKNYPNSKNKKELSLLNKESNLIKSLDSFNNNLQNSDFIKEIEERNAASLLEEVESEKTTKSNISKNKRNPRKPADNKKEIQSDKNTDSKNNETLEIQNSNSLPINEDLKITEEQKQNSSNSREQTRKNKPAKTFHLYTTNQTKNKKTTNIILEPSTSLTKNSETENKDIKENSVFEDTTQINSNSNYQEESIILPNKESKVRETNISQTPNIIVVPNVTEVSITKTRNDTDINNYEIDYETLKKFLGNKNFHQKPLTILLLIQFPLPVLQTKIII